MANTKERYGILKAVRENQNLKYKGKKIVIPDLQYKTTPAKKEKTNILKLLKKRKFRPRVHHLANHSLKCQGGIKNILI